tara:strand:+ start:64 stop:294 length:231 start_codon:yes stop_codon:yes gene_type:complete
MKLTKAKLKQIIKEEIEGMMKEVGQEPAEVEDEDEETPEERERRLRADDLKAAKEILKTRAGGYSGTALPGGKRIK